MADGWLVRIEVEAGRGEITPLVFAVAIGDHRDAIEAARQSPDVAEEQGRPRTLAEPWPVLSASIIAPIDAKTVEKLRLRPGELWNVYRPKITDRIQFASKP
jgi:hypothetical protein